MSNRPAATPGAVFLSYAHEDAEAARLICDALRAAGVEVWFDQAELRGGDVWDQKIRRQIRECALFVPIISANTQVRREGYFRREWNLACDRLLDMTRGTTFLLPVVIDSTGEREALVPEEFLRVQWTRFAHGGPPRPFVEQVQHLLAPGSTAEIGATAFQPPAPVSIGIAAPAHPIPPRRPRAPTRALILVSAAGAIIIAAGGALAMWFSRSMSAPPATELRTAPLTANAGWEGQPTFSPDGNQIAYVWNGETHDNFDIYVKLIGGGAPLRLTTDAAADISPAWSPDGRWIAFIREPPSRRNDIMMIPALGGPERKIGEIVTAQYHDVQFHLSWTHNGKWLIAAHRSGSGEQAGLFLVSPETGERRRLTTGAAFSPAQSPDGRRLAYVREAGMSVSELHVMNLSGELTPQGDPIRLLTLNQAIASPVWTRDSREILFSTGAHLAERGLYRIIAAPGHAPRREPIGEDGGAVAIAPAGRRMAYSRARIDWDIWKISLRSRTEPEGAPTRFISSTRIDSNPQYSPDGKRIVFNSHRSGAQEILVADSSGLNPMQLTSAKGPMVANPRWSPDGKDFVIHSMRGGVRGIDLVSATRGTFKRLFEGGGAQPAWSRDGKWIYYGNRGQLWKVAGDGGAPIQVTSKGGGGPALESSDGELLYYVRDARIWKMPRSGGPESKVLDEPLSYAMNFALVEDGLYMIAGRADDRAGTLCFFDFASERVTPVIKIPRWSLGLAVSPDGKSLLYTQTEEERGSIIVAEDFH